MIFSIPIYQGPQRSFLTQLRTRLIISLSVLVVCLLVSSALSIFVSLQQQQLGEQKVTIHDAESDLLKAMLDQETGLRGYITGANTLQLDPYMSGQLEYTIALQQLEQAIASTSFAAANTALKQFETSVMTWSTTYADVQLANMQAGNDTVARASLTQGKTIFDALRVSFMHLQTASDQDLAVLQVHTNIFTFGSLGAALLVTVLVLIWLWRTFRLFTHIQRNHLDALKETSLAFGSGDLLARVQTGPDEEFNELGQVFNAMASALLEQQKGLKDRDILEHVSLLSAILTESLDLPTLIQQFFQRILKTLDLQISALYLSQPDSRELIHFASRGIPPAAIQERFAFGEGLVGRTAEEREALMTTQQDAGAKAFSLRTLLGTALPVSMYYLPLIHGNDLLGVLVVGSIDPMREQVRNVLNVVSSNLASAIHNAQSYEQIQQQAQELAEHSRQQEESNQALRQQRDELSVLNNALEEANRVRSHFLSIMSHELRTPLTSIIGFGQMLQRPAVQSTFNPRQKQNIDRILKNAQHLLSLINDVLDLSKIDAGHMDISTSEVHLSEFLTAIVDETRSIAIARHLELRLEMQEELPILETDARKVRQILLNLISNALKFTEQGFISVQVTSQKITTEQNETGEQISIAVRDSGVGIPLEKQEHIFDAFYQVDSSNSRNYEGTGLGLSIVRELTALLGGRMEFESQPGQGSTFRLILPQHLREQRFLHDFRLHTVKETGNDQPASQPDVPSVPLDSVAQLQLQAGEQDAPLVIAVDDNPDVLGLIAQALEQSPYRLMGIQDSSRALEVIQELKPSAITLDVMMPKINGWQLLNSLKSNHNTAAIPVILLTVLEDRSAGYVLGADEYLVKPVMRENLLSVLQQLLAQKATTTQPDEAVPMPEVELPTQQDQTIGSTRPALLLHQVQDIPALVTRLVNEVGYQVQSTPQGQDIIGLIEEAHPHLLLLFVKLEEGLTIVEGDAINDMLQNFVDEQAQGEAPTSS
jgi:two-component system, chemotaxis family, sensor kinase CheA